MNADILNDLAARVEALAGQNRAIEYEIADATLGPMKSPYRRGYVQAYTASIDSAMTLLPPDAFWRVGHDADDPAWMMAQVSYDRGEGRLGFTTGTAETAAMAMTAAALRAHAAIAKENEGG